MRAVRAGRHWSCRTAFTTPSPVSSRIASTKSSGPSGALLEKMFSRFMEGRDPTEFTLKEKMDFIAQGVLSGKIFEFVKPANISLWNELSGYFARPAVKAKLAAQLTR